MERPQIERGVDHELCGKHSKEVECDETASNWVNDSSSNITRGHPTSINECIGTDVDTMPEMEKRPPSSHWRSQTEQIATAMDTMTAHLGSGPSKCEGNNAMNPEHDVIEERQCRRKSI